MASVASDRIVARLDELLATLGNPKAAYVVRSRLDRVLLLVKRYNSDERSPEEQRALAMHVARIEDSFRALRRRSEPFGEAWMAKLAHVRADLASLRSHFEQGFHEAGYLGEQNEGPTGVERTPKA